MRTQSRVFVVVGALMVLGGAASAVVAAGDDSVLRMMWWIFAATGAVLGVVFVLAGRYLRQFAPGSIENGIPATGTVVATADTGTTVNNLNMVLKATVVVDVPGRPPYQADVKLLLGRTQWGAIQPGMVLPLVVDPDDPRRVAFDPSRPVQATTHGALGTLGVAAGQPQVVTRSAADIIARGTATTGRLELVEPTGLAAGAMAPGLPADRADDPLVKVVFSYEMPGGAQGRQDAIVRVPDGKAGFLAAGAVVPVRYLADEPGTATIDWDRL